MGTNVETVFVNDRAQLDERVQRYLEQGGEVREQTEESVTLFVKKKMNVVVLIVGLILCLVPGLAYLIWYLAADQSQLVTVKIGAATNIGGYHPEPTADMAEKMNAARNDKPPAAPPEPTPPMGTPVTPETPAVGMADPSTVPPATPPVPDPTSYDPAGYPPAPDPTTPGPTASPGAPPGPTPPVPPAS